MMRSCGLTAGCELCNPVEYDVRIPRLPITTQTIYPVAPGSLIVPPDSWQRRYVEKDLERWARKMGREDPGFWIVDLVERRKGDAS